MDTRIHLIKNSGSEIDEVVKSNVANSLVHSGHYEGNFIYWIVHMSYTGHILVSCVQALKLPPCRHRLQIPKCDTLTSRVRVSILDWLPRANVLISQCMKNVCVIAIRVE